MKQTIYILALASAYWSCNSRATEKPSGKNGTEIPPTASVHQKQADIYIQNKSRYDPAFIEGLAGYSEPIKLAGHFIVTGGDTTYFPHDLPLNKKTIFKGSKDSRHFVLSVTRTNLTNLDYRFQLTDKKHRTIDSKSGKAVLSSLFFLASEIDVDSQTGKEYGSCEYVDSTAGVRLSIRIGIGLDRNGKKRAVLTYNGDGKNKPALPPDACPTLRTD